jgi:signal transduction histidine kinase
VIPNLANTADDYLYKFSGEISKVSALQDILEALVPYPESLGANTLTVFSMEPDIQLDAKKLQVSLHWKNPTTNPPVQNDALLHALAENKFTESTFPCFIEQTDSNSNSSQLSAALSRFYTNNAFLAGALIPLKANNSWIGLIHITWQNARQFTEEERRVLSIMGTQVAWVLYSVLLNDDIQKRTKRAEILLQLGTGLSQATNEEEILSALTSIIMHYNADTLILDYLDNITQSESPTITVMARWTRFPEETPPKQLRLKRARTLPSFLKQYIANSPNDNVILIEDLTQVVQNHDAAQLERTGFNYATSALIPLHRGEWQGLATINWKTPHIFSEEEKYIYAGLIQILAPTVASRRAFLRQETTRRESEQRAKELETVSKVNATASQNLDLEQLLQTVVDLSKSSFDFYFAHIYIVDPAGQYLVLTSTSGEIGKTMKEIGITRLTLDRDPSLAAQCARQRTGIIVNDVSKNLDFIPNPLLPEVRSEMAVPMLLGDTLIGVFHLQSKHINHFTDNVLLVMRALADEIAVAVQNVRYFDEQRKVTERLLEVDKLKNQFLATMSHELRTPLNAILNFTYFVSSGHFGPVNQKQIDTLAKVSHSATHLLGLINDVLDFSKIEAGMMQLFLEDVNLGLLIEGIMSTANGIPHANEVELITNIENDLPVIYGDKQRLRQIVLNLLSNALKFTDSGHVKLSVHRREAEILFSVSDTGMGIALEDQGAIFEAFKQTTDGMSKGGTGLGLPISKRLAEAHGGKLWLTSELNVGSTFFMSIPITTQKQHEESPFPQQ